MAESDLLANDMEIFDVQRLASSQKHFSYVMVPRKQCLVHQQQSAVGSDPRSAIDNTFFLLTLEQLSESPRSMNDKHALQSSFVEALAGFTAGILSTLVVHPLDIVKTRLQGKRSQL